jgi:hypothetical protein
VVSLPGTGKDMSLKAISFFEDPFEREEGLAYFG